MKKKKKPIFQISIPFSELAATKELEAALEAAVGKALAKFTLEDCIAASDHMDVVENIKSFDRKTAKGYRLNLLTEEFYKP
jgi:hypothetical protein